MNRTFVPEAKLKRVASADGEGSMAIAFVHQYLKASDLEPERVTG